MTNEFEKQLLKEIFRIADQLIQSNKVNPQGTIWKTFSYNDRYDPLFFMKKKKVFTMGYRAYYSFYIHSMNYTKTTDWRK